MAPALSAQDLRGGWTQVLNAHQIGRINRHLAESDEDNSPESNSDTEICLNWDGDLDIPNDSEDDWDTDDESGIEWHNGSEDSETAAQRNVSAAPNVL